MNCWPTIPVAPRIPTSILSTDHSAQNENAGLFVLAGV
jgi:hypothetical protein